MDIKIPVLTDLIQYSNFANFIAVMRVAYDAGVPILECLYLSNMTLTNHTLEARVEEATVKSSTKVSTFLRHFVLQEQCLK